MENKQIKLYTEEQVIAGIKLFRGVTQESAKKVVELLSSIDLPTDEKIYNESPHDSSDDYNIGYHNGYMKGAKWMRDKIKGGEDE